MHDYAAEALSRLTGQFSNSPKIRAMVEASLIPLSMFEEDSEGVRDNRWIDTAVGAQLDGAGAIVGEQRNGRGDDEYRAAIKFRVFVNVSEGTPNDLIRGLRFLTAPIDAQYLEIYPAGVVLFSNGAVIPAGIQATMQSLSPAAIETVPVAVSYGALPFRFSAELPNGELFVNGGADYLTAGGSDLQVRDSRASNGAATLGGVVPAELDVGGFYLDVGGPTLAVYHPGAVTAVGDNHLTGVFQ